jgi:hypothetical protein
MMKMVDNVLEDMILYLSLQYKNFQKQTNN